MSIRSVARSILEMAGLAGVAEVKAVPESGTDFPQPWTSNLFGGGPTTSGMNVSPDRSMAIAAVQRAVMTISEDVARMDLVLYQGRPRGAVRKEITDHPAVQVLAQRPNDWMTPFDYLRFHMMNYLLVGNHYDYMDRNSRGDLLQLIPIPSGRVSIWSSLDGELFYQVSRSSNHEMAVLEEAPLLIPAQYMLHDRGPSRDGLHGISAISWARETMGLALAGEDHAARTFSAGARPSGVLEHPKGMSPKTKADLRKDFEDLRGQAGMMKTLLLEGGMTFRPVMMSNVDVQFIESRRFQVEEVARIFDLPHHKMGIAESGAGRIDPSLAEQAYINTTLIRHLERIESLLNTRLLTAVEQQNMFFEFDLSRLLRGDMKTRYEAYAIGRQWGWFSVNDVLAAENLNPVANGNERMQPVNMVPLGTPPAAKQVSGPAGSSDSSPGTTAPDTQPPGADAPPTPKPSGTTDGSTGGKSNGHATEFP